jgi:protein TonB
VSTILDERTNMKIQNDPHAQQHAFVAGPDEPLGEPRHGHQTPDPETPPPTRSPDPEPDEYPAPTHAPVQEPRMPEPPIRA